MGNQNCTTTNPEPRSLKVFFWTSVTPGCFDTLIGPLSNHFWALGCIFIIAEPRFYKVWSKAPGNRTPPFYVSTIQESSYLLYKCVNILSTQDYTYDLVYCSVKIVKKIITPTIAHIIIFPFCLASRFIKRYNHTSNFLSMLAG